MMIYWELGILFLGFLSFLVFGRESRMPELFYRRQDTRRIRSYLDKKSYLNQLEFQKREDRKQQQAAMNESKKNQR